jgi:hypothetical protein
MPELIGLGFHGLLACSLGSNHERELKVDSHRRLKADGVSVPQDEEGAGRGHSHKQHDAGKNSGDRRSGGAGPPSTWPL